MTPTSQQSGSFPLKNINVLLRQSTEYTPNTSFMGVTQPITSVCTSPVSLMSPDLLNMKTIVESQVNSAYTNLKLAKEVPSSMEKLNQNLPKFGAHGTYDMD